MFVVGTGVGGGEVAAVVVAVVAAVVLVEVLGWLLFSVPQATVRAPLAAIVAMAAQPAARRVNRPDFISGSYLTLVCPVGHGQTLPARVHRRCQLR
jgi:hypothetical protein